MYLIWSFELLGDEERWSRVQRMYLGENSVPAVTRKRECLAICSYILHFSFYVGIWGDLIKHYNTWRIDINIRIWSNYSYYKVLYWHQSTSISIFLCIDIIKLKTHFQKMWINSCFQGKCFVYLWNRHRHKCQAQVIVIFLSLFFGRFLVISKQIWSKV